MGLKRRAVAKTRPNRRGFSRAARSGRRKAIASLANVCLPSTSIASKPAIPKPAEVEERERERRFRFLFLPPCVKLQSRYSVVPIDGSLILFFPFLFNFFGCEIALSLLTL